MTAMLTLTLLTLIAIFIVLKRLRPLSKNTPLSDIKDTHNINHNHSSSLENEPVSTSALPSKNCYVTLVQHDDEQNDYLLDKKTNSLIKRLSSNTSNGDIQNSSPRYDTSSTNVLCLSDEQNRALNHHEN